MATFRKRGKVWYFTYKDGGNKRVERKGFADKRETQRLAADLEVQARRAREGLIDPRAEEAKKWRTLPIADHLRDYRAYMVQKGNRLKYIGATHYQVAQVIRRFKLLADMTPEAVMARLKEMKGEGRLSSGRSEKTLLLYRGAAKRFSRWLYRQRRTSVNLLADMECFVSRETPRRPRRALSREEAKQFIAKVPPRRSLAYRILIATGMRIGELRSATPNSFYDLEGDAPRYALKSEDTKTGRAANIPIPKQLAGEIKKAIAEDGTKPGDAVNWELGSHPNRTFDQDLLDAGLRKHSPQGQLDPHAFRTTGITWLIESGANVKEVQEFARHQSPVTTLRFYAKVKVERIRELGDQLAACLPRLEL